MQASIRVARLRALRSVVLPSRRLLATPSGPVIPPTPPPPSGAAPVRPVVVTSGPVIVPGSSTLPQPPPPAGDVPPLPPPPPPRKPRRLIRRTLIYASLGILIFYPVSGWLSTQYEAYREFFVSTFPGGEAVAEYADDHAWETFGYGTVQKKAVEGWQNVTGGDKPSTTVDKAKAAGQDLAKRAEEKARAAKAETERKAAEAKARLEKTRDDAAKRAKAAEASAKQKAGDLKREAEKKAESVKADTKAAAADAKSAVVEATHSVQDKAKELAEKAQQQLSKATAAIPFNASEGIEGIVREAEKALGSAKDKTVDAAEKVKDALTPSSAPYDGPRILPDTQRPRELRPETVVPQKPSFEGKEKFAGTLPLGFEPPPGYYVPAAPKEQVAPAAPTLPLLGPKVKEFASEEPIISQLASTIDSLTSSLSTSTGRPVGDASNILSKAQDDLTALSARLTEVKKAERQKLEEAIAKRTADFDTMLRHRDAERAQSEAGLKDEWTKERQTMVSEWKSAMDKELESQREGIEKRLHEEVISQGIELQRRWLRSIKAQVESERGGRLAKLDSLTTSLKQLERITLDNSATLDDNVRLHKVWSALRAVQTKADNGDVAFDDELRALKAISSPIQGESTPAQTTIISATLNQLEKSGIPQTGVKSFAALSSWFSNSVSPRVQSASLVPAPEHATVVSHIASRALSGLMFRPKAGLVEGDDVGAILARAEWCLGEKDLDGAAREVNRLRGWPGRLAADWLREARRTLEVRQALEVVGTEATLASLLLV